jgi:ABC-type glycerol-3-phosphate transport system substrate-binding protein
MAQGTEAMQINGPWTPGSLAKVAPEKRYAYTWPPLPPARKGKKIQSTGGHFSLLPKGSPHPDPAFEFVEFLTTERAEQLIFDGQGWIGARKSFLPKIHASQYRGLDFYIRSATTADDRWADPVNPIEGFFADRWKEQADAVMLGQASPKSALQELQRLCTEELRQRLGT